MSWQQKQESPLPQPLVFFVPPYLLQLFFSYMQTPPKSSQHVLVSSAVSSVQTATSAAPMVVRPLVLAAVARSAGAAGAARVRSVAPRPRSRPAPATASAAFFAKRWARTGTPAPSGRSSV